MQAATLAAEAMKSAEVSESNEEAQWIWRVTFVSAFLGALEGKLLDQLPTFARYAGERAKVSADLAKQAYLSQR